MVKDHVRESAWIVFDLQAMNARKSGKVVFVYLLSFIYAIFAINDLWSFVGCMWTQR